MHQTGRYGGTVEAIEARAKAARQWFKNRPEKAIVVVTHGGVRRPDPTFRATCYISLMTTGLTDARGTRHQFLHYFTEDWADSNKFPGTGWANTEFRSYRFKDPQDPQNDDNASLVETNESRHRRRGTEKPLTDTEKMELRETTEKSWETEGHNLA